MKLIVFGATGSIGRRVVEHALQEGHEVTAFARQAGTLDIAHPRLVGEWGDVLDPVAVTRAVRGHDAAIIALGDGRKGTVRSAGTRHIIEAMQHTGVRRLVCLSTLGAGDSRPLLNFVWKRIMFGLLLKDAYADHEAQEALVRASDCDWVIVRPGAFTDGPATDHYQHGLASTMRNLKLKVSRADVASFMVKQLSGDAYLHQSPALSY